MVLDKPSAKSLASIQAMHTSQLIPEHHKQTIAFLKEKQGLVKTSEPKKRKRKRAAGPNPLSCLKKKRKTEESQQSSTSKKKGNRKRSKRKSDTMTAAVQDTKA